MFRALHQVIVVVVFALSCLQKANGLICKDVANIKEYWSDRMDCMQEEIRIRRDFLDRAETFACEEIPSDVLEKDIKTGRENLSNIMSQLSALSINARKITTTAQDLKELEDSRKLDQKEINTHYSSIEELLPSALDESDLVSEKIKEFDSHMLEVIKKCSKMKKGENKVQELTVFKLAEMNKLFAVEMVYSFFGMDLLKLDDAKEAVVTYIYTKMSKYVSILDPMFYMQIVCDDPVDREVDLLAFADEHFPSLFGNYEKTKKIILPAYFDLIKEDISEEEVEKYKDMTPRKAIKLIMIECAMNRDLIDHRKNNLFSNLGKIIVSIGRPFNIESADAVDIDAAREEQNEILDALSVLWSDYNNANAYISPNDIDIFCMKNKISLDDLKIVQNIFMSAIWMYKLNIASPASEEL
ncbi:hypothetical protein NEMIN01_2140, partial [Nematocida minor]|uniref:uncharacterized protein n=1 Tax=Nematocida minor TaxID=1912983 RepID=UPI002220E54A